MGHDWMSVHVCRYMSAGSLGADDKVRGLAGRLPINIQDVSYVSCAASGTVAATILLSRFRALQASVRPCLRSCSQVCTSAALNVRFRYALPERVARRASCLFGSDF